MPKMNASTWAICFLGVVALSAVWTKQPDIALSATSAMAGAITMKAVDRA